MKRAVVIQAARHWRRNRCWQRPSRILGLLRDLILMPGVQASGSGRRNRSRSAPTAQPPAILLDLAAHRLRDDLVAEADADHRHMRGKAVADELLPAAESRGDPHRRRWREPVISQPSHSCTSAGNSPSTTRRCGRSKPWPASSRLEDIGVVAHLGAQARRGERRSGGCRSAWLSVSVWLALDGSAQPPSGQGGAIFLRNRCAGYTVSRYSSTRSARRQLGQDSAVPAAWSDTRLLDQFRVQEPRHDASECSNASMACLPAVGDLRQVHHGIGVADDRRRRLHLVLDARPGPRPGWRPASGRGSRRRPPRDARSAARLGCRPECGSRRCGSHSPRLIAVGACLPGTSRS